MDGAGRAQCVGVGDTPLAEGDRGICQQHAGRKRVDFAGVESGRALAQEDFEVGASKGVTVEGDIALDGHEVTDVQAQARDGHLENISFASAKADW